jgi:hypothetical protein
MEVSVLLYAIAALTLGGIMAIGYINFAFGTV